MADEKAPIHLTPASMADAAAMLGRAFVNDPCVSRIYRNAATRAQRFARTARRIMDHAVRYGEVQASSPRMEGVAVWLAPNSPEPTRWDLVTFVAVALARSFDLHAVRCGLAYLKHTQAMRRRHIEGPHWYLQFLGVDPAHRGGGHAGALLRSMLERLDELQVPCCLDTENAINVPIYEHFGFRVLDTRAIPVIGCPCWLMARPVGGAPGNG